MKQRKRLVLTLSSSLRFLLVLLAFLAVLVPAASAGSFSLNAWTNDTSSGIVPGQTLWAYHFGSTNTAVVNGVTVPGTGTNVNPSIAGQFSMTGVSFVFENDANSLTALGGSGSAVMASSFLYGGAPWRFTVQGLTTGQVYTVSIYGVGRESPPATRASYFTNGTDSIYVDENSLGSGKGLRVDYTFTATATTNLTLVMPTNSSTFHTYGLALRQRLLVTTNSNAGPGSLRQAALDAATFPGTNTITFASALSGSTITLTSGQITIATNLTIDASGLANGITISGNNSSRIFAVLLGTTVTLDSLTLRNGFASGDHAGAISTGGNLTLRACTLSSNYADISGGGIYNFGNLTLQACTLSGNSAGDRGGAILSETDLSSLKMTLVNSTIRGNTAVQGGGIHNEDGRTEIIHCTITENTAPAGQGGGVSSFGDAFTQTTVRHSIIAGNSESDVAFVGDVSNSFISSSHNLIGTGNALAAFNQPGDLTNAVPLLAPLGSYGGSTPTMPPLPGSLAIDAATIIAGLTTDQRGSARNVGAAPDIGAVESGSLWVQNNNNSGADSLRDVLVNSASVTNTKTILFVTNLSGAAITLTSQIVLSNNVAIDASSLSGGITVSGGNTTRIFFVNSGQTVSLLGLTLAGGNASAGGAIYNSPGATLSLTRCTLFGNSGSGGGGAIFNPSGILALTECTLSGNSASFGGAIAHLVGALTLTHCTFALNHSTGTLASSGGGAIDNYNGATLTLTACILAGNTAVTTNGPDLWMENGTLTAIYCLVGDGTSSKITNNVNGNIVGTGVSPIDALLAPLGNYGGSTQTMPPLPGSPAIDAAGATGFTADQRGFPRPVGLAADIGAVEGIYNAAGPGKLTGVTRLGNGSFKFAFTNYSDNSYSVLASTNVALPLAQWSNLGLAVETSPGSGQFQFTDPQAANYTKRFYRVRTP